ncbi:MAG: MFS transporter, partial [Desulfovibrio sp.]|nr:MFS transporter [Desulfovibrio sp.]
LCIKSIPEVRQKAGRVHGLREYKIVLNQPGVAALLFMEACGIFTFAAIGNLIPLRIAEIQSNASEGLIGCVYIGYSIGLVASLTLNPLRRFFGSTARLLLFGALLYAVSLCSLFPDSIWALFGGLWVIAFGEFVVHSVAPGQINLLATKSGQCDTAMVNGLFLSVYYCGGVLGSWLPPVLYAAFDWSAAVLCMMVVQIASLVVAFWFKGHVQEL